MSRYVRVFFKKDNLIMHVFLWSDSCVYTEVKGSDNYAALDVRHSVLWLSVVLESKSVS